MISSNHVLKLFSTIGEFVPFQAKLYSKTSTETVFEWFRIWGTCISLLFNTINLIKTSISISSGIFIVFVDILGRHCIEWYDQSTYLYLIRTSVLDKWRQGTNYWLAKFKNHSIYILQFYFFLNNHITINTIPPLNRNWTLLMSKTGPEYHIITQLLKKYFCDWRQPGISSAVTFGFVVILSDLIVHLKPFFDLWWSSFGTLEQEINLCWLC